MNGNSLPYGLAKAVTSERLKIEMAFLKTRDNLLSKADCFDDCLVLFDITFIMLFSFICGI